MTVARLESELSLGELAEWLAYFKITAAPR